MKRKQLAKRVAIAMLSAATVMTAAPVGAFAAQNVTFEASYAATYGGQSVTDDNFKKDLTTALASAHYPATTTSYANLSTKDASSDFGLTVSGYKFGNFKVVGRTAPSYASTATGGQLVMPTVTVQADVEKGSAAFGDAANTAYGTITFTTEATALEKTEQVAAAKAVIEGVGGTASDAAKYKNEDNSTSLKKAVGDILKDNATFLSDIVDGAGTLKEGVTVSQSSITAATKSAAGSEGVSVDFKIKLIKSDDTDDTTDPSYDASKTGDQYTTGSASYTATIKKLGVDSGDADYQAKVEAALKNVSFTNSDFGTSTYGLNDTTNKTFSSSVALADAAHGKNVQDKVAKALAAVGVNENDYSVALRHLTKATHKADGSVEILVDQKRTSDDAAADAVQYATVTIPVTHADDTAAIADEVSTKIVGLVKDYVKDSKAISPTSADEKAQIKEVEANLTKAVNDALADKLDGSNTIASEIDKVEVKVNDYTAATTDTPGYIKKASFVVTFKGDHPDPVFLTSLETGFTATPNDNDKQLSFNYDGTQTGAPGTPNGIALYKLDTAEATSLTLPEETVYSLGADELKVTPNFTPANANNYTIRWTVGKSDVLSVEANSAATSYANATAATPILNNAANGNASAAQTVYLSNDGLTLVATNTAKAGDTVDLTADLIDSDGLVAATAKTTVKVVKGFVDVQNPRFYAYKAITDNSLPKLVKVNGEYKKVAVIEGVGDNKFNPDGDVTRGQFVTFLYRLAQQQADNTKIQSGADETAAKKVDSNAAAGQVVPTFKDSDAQTKFTDVDSKAYYAKAVDWAVENGITSGKTDTTFDPNGKVTRAEAATFLYRYYANGQNYNAADFSDVPTTAYYANAVGWASANGITQGKTATTFAPNDTTTRKEAAAFIYRATNTAKINK